MLSRIHLKFKDSEDALECARKAFGSDPDHYLAYQTLAWALRFNLETEEAIIVGNKAIDVLSP